MDDTKAIEFRGSSLNDLRAFPADARRDAGFQLDRIQHGHEPDDWKPMGTVGSGVREVRVHEESGAFRVIYLAKMAGVVYVLHCFHKKTEKTSKRDMDLATRRFRDLMQELKS